MTALIDAVTLSGAEVVACYAIVDILGSMEQFPNSKALVHIDIYDNEVVVL